MIRIATFFCWLALSGTSFAGPYFEAGAYYIENPYSSYDYSNGATENERAITNINESGSVAAHIALGYEFELIENLSLNFELRHQSDPKSSGEKDLIDNEFAGIKLRYSGD